MTAPALALEPTVRETPARRAALERLFARISDVSTLPTVAQRVLGLAYDEASTATDLSDVIQTDPALVSRILRRVNSSFYGLRYRVADLQTAINLLGYREIHNLVLSVFVSRWFERPFEHGPYSRQSLWMHSVGVALTARLVSAVTGRAKPEEAYVGGLLHDIGFILLDQHLRRHFVRVVDELRPATPTTKVEARIFTFDHAQLGAAVAKKWRFPERITEAILFHHEPHRYLGPNRELVYIVAIANYLCAAYGWTSLGVQNVPPPSEAIYAALGLDGIALTIIQDELPETLEKATVMSSM